MGISRKNLIILTLILILLISYGSALLAAGDKDIINMNFKGADIRDVLRTIAKVADINLLTDGSIQGEITVSLNDMTFKQAIKLITQTQGLDYVWDNNTVIVAPPEKIRELYLERSLETIKIKYASLEEIKGILEEIYPTLVVEIDRNNNNLIIKGVAEEISGVKELIKNMDVKKEISIKTVQIKHIDLGILLTNIENLYPEVKAEETINKQLIIQGDEKEVDLVMELIKKLDIHQQVKTVSLEIKNIGLSEIKEQLEDYDKIVFNFDEGSGVLEISGQEELINGAIELIKSLDIESKNITEFAVIDYLDLEEILNTLNNLYPDVNIQSNKIRQELVFKGKESDIAELLKLLDKLDKPRKQVIIEARVEEVSTDGLSEMGFDIDEKLAKIIVNEDDDGKIHEVNMSFPEFIKMLETNGQTNNLANPRLMTLSGEKAELLIGDKIAIIDDDSDDDDDDDDDDSIEYIEAGINLIFTPWVTKDNKITLEVNPEVSSVSTNANGDYKVDTREAHTKIRLEDGETFAIGGLIKEDEMETLSKVPYLGDIPILGSLFRNKQMENIKTELIIFITPHIVKEDDKLQADSVPEEQVKASEREFIGLTDEELKDILSDKTKNGE
ncbi:secretin N-terminal domain-containing protein [Halocella sp. SP3-1]|uniref:secretin N-terminal domain-containing protein n=1 Tax=Halocella sp. SP3-1 TaxID=2382161 RepID=UPI000F7514AE|nr:secretin N-terminal domain-containing protein [Halocella sp. SP3-1]AZO95681.1 hypothetical protein D7D81_14400 [Halocella sp. SP3-1]